MKKLINKLKKSIKKDKKEWYTAEMVTVDGTPYTTGVQAISEEQASEFILQDAYKGNRIVSIRKENILHRG